MPKENSKIILDALYEVDENGKIGYYCEPCRQRLDIPLPLPAARPGKCTECIAFATGRHPDQHQNRREYLNLH